MPRLYRALAFCIATRIRNGNPHTDAFETYDEVLSTFAQGHREEIEAGRGDPASNPLWHSEMQDNIDNCRTAGGY